MRGKIEKVLKSNIRDVEVHDSTGIRFSMKPQDYPYDMQRVIHEYLEGIDTEILEMITELRENGNIIYSDAYRDENNNPSPMLLYKKEINGTYYFVEAVGENTYKKFWTVSAYINKKELTHVSASDNVSRQLTSETLHASRSSKDSIPEKSENVNRAEQKNSENVRYSMKDPIADEIERERNFNYSEGESAKADANVNRNKVTKFTNYSYEELVEKPPLSIVVLPKKIPMMKNGKIDIKEIVAIGKSNARKQNNPNNSETNTYVHIDDIGLDVLLGKNGMVHGIARSKETALAIMKIGDVLKNSIVVNELDGSATRKTDMSYVLLGACRDTENFYVVRSLVSKL